MDYFRTERSVVRSFEENDAQFLFDYFEKPRVNCFLDEKLNSLQEAEKEVLKSSIDKSQYVICLPDDTLIGNLLPIRKEMTILLALDGILTRNMKVKV